MGGRGGGEGCLTVLSQLTDAAEAQTFFFSQL